MVGSLELFCVENCNKWLIAEGNFFQAVKSYLISSLAKAFDRRLRSLKTLLRRHCIMVTVRSQCIMGQTSSRFCGGLYQSSICLSLWKWGSVFSLTSGKLRKDLGPGLQPTLNRERKQSVLFVTRQSVFWTCVTSVQRFLTNFFVEFLAKLGITSTGCVAFCCLLRIALSCVVLCCDLDESLPGLRYPLSKSSSKEKVD